MSEVGLHRDRSEIALNPEVDRPTGRRRSDRIVGASRATQEVLDQAMASGLPLVRRMKAPSRKPRQMP